MTVHNVIETQHLSSLLVEIDVVISSLTLGLFLCCRAYEQLNVKHEPLQLIQPQFETPLPVLQPAVSNLLANTDMENPCFMCSIHSS